MEATKAMIPIVLFICMALTIFGLYYMRNKENMALIERGINPRESYRKFSSLTYLKYGMLFIGVGLGLLLAYIIDESMPHKGFHVGPDRVALYFSLIGICGGLGLVISYFIERKEMQRQQHKD